MFTGRHLGVPSCRTSRSPVARSERPWSGEPSLWRFSILLVRKNVLTVDDAQGVLKTAQSSLVNAPTVQGSLDGARIVGEIKDILAGRERGHSSERRG